MDWKVTAIFASPRATGIQTWSRIYRNTTQTHAHVLATRELRKIETIGDPTILSVLPHTRTPKVQSVLQKIIDRVNRQKVKLNGQKTEP